MAYQSAALFNLEYEVILKPNKQLSREVLEFIGDQIITVGLTDEWEITNLQLSQTSVEFFISSSIEHSPLDIVKIIKSVTSKSTMLKYPELAKQTKGDKFWSLNHYIGTIGEPANQNIRQLVLGTLSSSP